MGVLKNPRWERFCHLIVEGEACDWTQSQAYIEAGYKAKAGNSSEAAASRLLKKYQPILDRIAELKAEIAEQNAVTKKSLIAELNRAQKMAEQIKQPSASISATTVKAKLSGLLIERQEVRQTADFSDNQSAAEIAESLIKLANPQATITPEMVEQMVAELQRHQQRLSDIASKGTIYEQ